MIVNINSKYPCRSLTPSESDVVNLVVSTSLRLSNNLIFDINHLNSDISLELSGENKIIDTCKDSNGISHDISWLENELSKERCELHKSLSSNLVSEKENLLKTTMLGLSEQTFNINQHVLIGENDEQALLGEYQRENKKVVIYLNNIEEYTEHQSEEIKYLIVGVLVHEFFHVFFETTGFGSARYLDTIEEPIAEFGMLYFLEQLAAKTISDKLNTDLRNLLAYNLYQTKKKKNSFGCFAAYGFGDYIYSKFSRQSIPSSSAEQFLARFANLSNHINSNDKTYRIYKYLLYPNYIFSESNTFKWLEKVMDTAESREYTASLLEEQVIAEETATVSEPTETYYTSASRLIYYRKMFPHDMTHEVSVTKDVVDLFFGGETSLPFVDSNGNPQTVIINSATDPRFGGAFVSLRNQTGAGTNDVISIQRNSDGLYEIKLLQPTAPQYSFVTEKLTGKKRHLIVEFPSNSIVYVR